MTITTGSSSITMTLAWPCGGDDDLGPCVWREMHHVDDEGNHWCPTGFMWCHTHSGTGTIDGPGWLGPHTVHGQGYCQLWGEKP